MESGEEVVELDRVGVLLVLAASVTWGSGVGFSV